MFLNGLTYEQLIERLQQFELKVQDKPEKRLEKYMKIQKVNDKSKCQICNKNNPKPIITPCNHIFHLKCILEQIRHNQLRCPQCDTNYGAPIQPPGTYQKHIIKDSCAGYEKNDTIVITYEFDNGLKDGIHYRGTKQICFIPNTAEGQELEKLSKDAFDKGLIFTIGRSLQDGHKYQVQFNDLHHKTSLNGGKYGYPDPNYINRMITELKSRLKY